MKKNYILLINTFLITIVTLAQSGSPANPYYSGFNWTLTGAPLKDALSTITISKHTNLLSYTPGVWEASKITDLDPSNSANVILVYGFENGTDSDYSGNNFDSAACERKSTWRTRSRCTQSEDDGDNEGSQSHAGTAGKNEGAQ